MLVDFFSEDIAVARSLYLVHVFQSMILFTDSLGNSTTVKDITALENLKIQPEEAFQAD